MCTGLIQLMIGLVNMKMNLWFPEKADSLKC